VRKKLTRVLVRNSERPLEDRFPASGWHAASTAPRSKRRHGRYRSHFSRRYGAAPAIPRA